MYGQPAIVPGCAQRAGVWEQPCAPSGALSGQPVGAQWAREDNAKWSSSQKEASKLNTGLHKQQISVKSWFFMASGTLSRFALVHYDKMKLNSKKAHKLRLV
jgi:hypothetical protein